MPAKSIAQRRLMAAAEHGATFPMAEKVRESMTRPQMREFAVGSEKELPSHVKSQPLRNMMMDQEIKKRRK